MASANEDTWFEHDTTPERVESALREQLRLRHAEDNAVVPARVLNLVVVADREWKGEIANRLERVGDYHASRTILCTVEDGKQTIDATVVTSSDKRTAGGISVLRERVELDLGSRHLPLINTIIDPIKVAAIPTVLWSPHGRDEAVEVLLPVIDVILIDSDDPSYFDGPGAALSRAAELRESAYVVDLAWLRTTPWRERIAAAFDPADRRPLLEGLQRVEVRHNPGSVVSALLFSGWLASRLGWQPEAGALGVGGALRGTAGPATFVLSPVDLSVPGISGVTVRAGDDFSLSLDRSEGGLTALQQAAGEPAREWRVLGASRGEGGILGDGVRQALLRDPVYGPALVAARRFEP